MFIAEAERSLIWLLKVRIKGQMNRKACEKRGEEMSGKKWRKREGAARRTIIFEKPKVGGIARLQLSVGGDVAEGIDRAGKAASSAQGGGLATE